MDEDANKLLVEIRDILRESSESQVAFRKELMANAKRGRRIVRFIILPFLLITLSIVGWGIISSSQREQERNQENERFREELRKRMDERKNLIRPKGLAQARQILPNCACLEKRHAYSMPSALET